MDSDASASLEALAEYFSLHCYGQGSAGAELNDLFALRYQIYCLECHFLNATRYPDGLEIDSYDQHSVHFAATNTGGMVAGTVRLVLPLADDPFPVFDHCPPLPDFKPPPEAESGEVSRLAVKREYPRHTGDALREVNQSHLKRLEAPDAPPNGEMRVNTPLLVLGLYRQIYRYSCENGVRYWYAAMEKGLARVLRIYGFHFTPIGPEIDYYGLVTPYLGDLRKLERQLEASNPALLWWFRSGP